MSEAANGNGHARWEGDVAAYALNALEAGEVRLFEGHLAGCQQCRQELAVLRAVVEALPAAGPTLVPPIELKDRVMATVRAEALEQEASAERRGRTPGKGPIVTWPAWLTQRVAAGAVTLIALLVVVAAFTLGGGGAARTYAGIVDAPGASASVRQSGSSAQLRFSKLPAPPTDRIYEVWLERKAKAPEPTGALFATGTGSVALPGNLHGVHAVLVTAEPRPDGSRVPTRAPIIVVRLA
jgi:Anti-sigma-K factor rskA